MLYIVEQNNRPGYKVYMPTTPIWFKYHKPSYKDIQEFKTVDKRLHGWCDLCIINKDGETKYYKFIETNTDKVYNGWLKKWNKITDNNHFVVIYTNDPTLQNRKYAIYRMNEFSQFVYNYTDTTTGYDEEGFYINKFYTKKCINIQFDARTSTRRYEDIKQCMEYAIDNKHEYLLHKHAGYKYTYKNWEYSSLSQLYNNTIYSIKYKTLDSFRKAFQRGTIKDVSKAPVSYLDEVELNKNAKEVSLLTQSPSVSANALPIVDIKKETERLGTTDVESKFACLVSKLNETKSSSQDKQMTELDKNPIHVSMRRDVESWDISIQEPDFGYLRDLMEQERQNKTINKVEWVNLTEYNKYIKE